MTPDRHMHIVSEFEAEHAAQVNFPEIHEEIRIIYTRHAIERILERVEPHVAGAVESIRSLLRDELERKGLTRTPPRWMRHDPVKRSNSARFARVQLEGEELCCCIGIGAAASYHVITVASRRYGHLPVGAQARRGSDHTQGLIDEISYRERFLS